jgi:hypothetical protein
MKDYPLEQTTAQIIELTESQIRILATTLNLAFLLLILQVSLGPASAIFPDKVTFCIPNLPIILLKYVVQMVTKF